MVPVALEQLSDTGSRDSLCEQKPSSLTDSFCHEIWCEMGKKSVTPRDSKLTHVSRMHHTIMYIYMFEQIQLQ